MALEFRVTYFMRGGKVFFLFVFDIIKNTAVEETIVFCGRKDKKKVKTVGSHVSIFTYELYYASILWLALFFALRETFAAFDMRDRIHKSINNFSLIYNDIATKSHLIIFLGAKNTYHVITTPHSCTCGNTAASPTSQSQNQIRTKKMKTFTLTSLCTKRTRVHLCVCVSSITAIDNRDTGSINGGKSLHELEHFHSIFIFITTQPWQWTHFSMRLMYERSTTTCCELVLRDMEKDKKQQLSVSALHSLSSTIRRRDGSVITFCTMEKEDECTLRGIYNTQINNTLSVQIFHLTHFIFHISPDNFPFSFITALCSVLLCMMIHILIYYQDAFVQT